MSGSKVSKIKLNNTLRMISRLLISNEFNHWFIAYGTLLGIVRNNSCIDGDDDIDIICDIKDYDIVKGILLKEKFELEYGYGIGSSKRLLKTKGNDDYVTIDFYMADVDTLGNFNEKWERSIWSECYINKQNDFIQINWEGTILNLPYNFKQKLRGRYGRFWRIPQKTKGIRSGKYSKPIRFILNIFWMLPSSLRIKIKKFIENFKYIYRIFQLNDNRQI